jgi:hypothetical protein
MLVYFRWGVRELFADEKNHKNQWSGHNSNRAAAPLELKVCDMFTHTVFKFQPDRPIISRVIQSPRFGTLWKKFENFKPSQLLNGSMDYDQIRQVWVSHCVLHSLKFWARFRVLKKSYSKDPASELVFFEFSRLQDLRTYERLSGFRPKSAGLVVVMSSWFT